MFTSSGSVSSPRWVPWVSYGRRWGVCATILLSACSPSDPSFWAAILGTATLLGLGLFLGVGLARFGAPRLGRRILTRLHLRSRHCEDCAHFDLAGGQEAIQRDPHLGRIHLVLSPDQMLGVHTEGDESKYRRKTPETIRKRLRPGQAHVWSDYGACSANECLTHRVGSCEKWA